MKKILLLLTAVMAITYVSAQDFKATPPPSDKLKSNEYQTFKLPNKNITRGGGDTAHLDIDYDIDDFNLSTNNSVTYGGFRWYMNSEYTIQDTAGGLVNPINYFYVTYDTLYDAVNGIPYTPNTYSSLKIDSIGFVGSWVKTTTSNDTLEVSIVQVNDNGYPTNVTIWDTLALYPLAATIYDNLDSVAIIYFTPPPSLVITNPHFAIKVQWFASTLDTFYFLAGYPENSSANCSGGLGAAQTDYVYNAKSGNSYYKQGNSFAYWVTERALLPTANGGDIFYDCDGGTETSPTPEDGLNFIQNIDLFTAVTLNLYPAGVTRLNPDIATSYVFPNPSGDNTSLYFSMSNASVAGIISVYDITGKVVQSINVGHLNAGKHQQEINTSGLASGIYMYSIATDNGSAYGKFVKQ